MKHESVPFCRYAIIYIKHIRSVSYGVKHRFERARTYTLTYKHFEHFQVQFSFRSRTEARQKIVNLIRSSIMSSSLAIQKTKHTISLDFFFSALNPLKHYINIKWLCNHSRWLCPSEKIHKRASTQSTNTIKECSHCKTAHR